MPAFKKKSMKIKNAFDLLEGLIKLAFYKVSFEFNQSFFRKYYLQS